MIQNARFELKPKNKSQCHSSIRIVWYNVMTDVWTCGCIVLQLSHYLMVIERPKCKIHVGYVISDVDFQKINHRTLRESNLQAQLLLSFENDQIEV